MRLFIFILLFLMTSCVSVKIMPEFQAYLPPGMDSISFVFGAMSATNRAGECYTWGYVHNTVVVNYEEWIKMSPRQKQWLVNHELGHCYEGIMQHDNTEKNGCPVSKMYWRVPPNSCITPKGDPK